jgi:hypothetical protein
LDFWEGADADLPLLEGAGPPRFLLGLGGARWPWLVDIMGKVEMRELQTKEKGKNQRKGCVCCVVCVCVCVWWVYTVRVCVCAGVCVMQKER